MRTRDERKKRRYAYWSVVLLQETLGLEWGLSIASILISWRSG